MDSPNVRIALADDQRFVRVSLRSILSREPGMEVVGEASNGVEALELCIRERPDVIIMDIEMPEMDGMAATRKIKKERPGTVVVVLTSHEEPDYLLEAIKAGAAGYLLKEHAIERVVDSIRRAVSGESPLDQELAMRLLQRVAGEKDSEARTSPPSGTGESRRRRELTESLTAREREVLSLLAEGYSNQQIAGRLFVGVGTVKTHVHSIMSKLEVADRTQAAVLALRLGLTREGQQ